MNTRTAIAIALAAAATSLAPSIAGAQVFKCTEGSGLVVYSDKPCQSARKSNLPDSKPEVKAMAQADDEPKSATELLRAVGPDKAIDRNGRVYYRVAGGYADRTGVLIPGVAQGHR